MLQNDNEKVVDINKVAYCSFYWSKDDDSLHLKKKPRQPTWLGKVIDKLKFAYPYHMEYPHETLIERARRLELIDIWIPVCVVKIHNGRPLRFVGDKAKSFWKAWNSKIYSK